MDCCDICGDVGVAEALITCCQCNINCEHTYCMRIIVEEYIDDWCCEACEPSTKTKPLSSCLTDEVPRVSKLTNSVNSKSRKLVNESRGSSVAWEKVVATGKTKYICVNEAIMLSSGENKSLANSNVDCRSKFPRPTIGIKETKRSQMKSRTVTFSEPSRQTKPQGPGDMEISERKRPQFKKLSEVQRSMSSLQTPEAPTSKRVQVEQPTEVQSPPTMATRLIKEPSSPKASPFTISGGIGRTIIELRTSNAENVNHNLLPGLDECSCSPALDALWKGSFSIHDDDRHGKMIHQFQAHPSSKVHRKIYEISKQMPEVLHFQLVPLKESWINLFKEFEPDERDIGLYFFPSVGERSEDYISLIESIGVKNLALRKQIADVELLVFTSKLLPVSFQCWEGKSFLWGVFHRLKRDTTAPLHDGSEEVDMEIDMIGGISVGRKDVPVNREPLRDKCIQSYNKDSVTTTPINSSSRCIFDPIATVHSSVSVKMENDDLVPPGFEEVYRLRVIEGSSSFVRELKRSKADDHDGIPSFPANLKSKYL